MGDGGRRTQPRERAPEPVTSAQMSRVKSSRLPAVEALCQVMRIPKVEVADLRALDADNGKRWPAGTSNAVASRGSAMSSASLDSSERAAL